MGLGFSNDSRVVWLLKMRERWAKKRPPTAKRKIKERMVAPS